MLTGNAVIAQSGGPTAVINSSVAGVVHTWLARPDAPGRIYAAISGIRGVLEENMVDMAAQDRAFLNALRYTPGAGIFSCRYKVTDDDQKKMIDIFRKYNIRYFFYNGGNDSMDTAHRTEEAARAAGYEMRIIGVPKTVDNDLPETDHCPGFGSAAKYLATTVLETGIDLRSVATKNKVVILEAMGRDAGWLAGSGILAQRRPEDAPHLVYLPEVAFDVNKFLQDLMNIYQANGCVYVVVSEGIADDKGRYIAAGGVADAFGHVQLSGAGETLKSIVEKETGLKTRCNTLGSAQRSAGHWASKTDADEAYMSGAKAVGLALAGESGIMVTLVRETDEEGRYQCRTGSAPLAAVANREKKVPLEWICPAGNNVTREFIDYAAPLIVGEVDVPMLNGLPDYRYLDPSSGRLK